MIYSDGKVGAYSVSGEWRERFEARGIYSIFPGARGFQQHDRKHMNMCMLFLIFCDN